MEDKEWRCQNKQCRAILGMIRWNGDGVPQLMLLRHSLDMSLERPADVDVLGPLVGQMPVRCEDCDHISLWDISVNALAELISGLRPDQLEQLQVRVLRGRGRKVRSADDKK